MSAKQLNLPGVQRVDMREVKGRNKHSAVQSSNAMKNALAIIEHVKENGISPFEGFTVLDMAEIKKTDPELSKLSTAFFSFVTELKKVLKISGTYKKLKVIARNAQNPNQAKVYLGNLDD